MEGWDKNLLAQTGWVATGWHCFLAYEMTRNMPILSSQSQEEASTLVPTLPSCVSSVPKFLDSLGQFWSARRSSTPWFQIELYWQSQESKSVVDQYIPQHLSLSLWACVRILLEMVLVSHRAHKTPAQLCTDSPCNPFWVHLEQVSAWFFRNKWCMHAAVNRQPDDKCHKSGPSFHLCSENETDNVVIGDRNFTVLTHLTSPWNGTSKRCLPHKCLLLLTVAQVSS